MNIIKVNRKDIQNSHTPILDYCRKLIAEGLEPSSKLEVYRNNEIPDITVNSINEGAKLAVSEDPTPRFVKYRPMSEKDRVRLRLKGPQKGYGSSVRSLKKKIGS